MSKPDIWYVAFGLDKSNKSDDKVASGPARTTKTFKSEDEAKKFALEIIAKGYTASAGTLNPHQPRQTVASTKIEQWANPHGF